MANATRIQPSAQGYQAPVAVLKAFLGKTLAELQRIRGIIAEHEKALPQVMQPNYRILVASLTRAIEGAADGIERDNAVLAAAMGIAKSVGERFAVVRIMLIKTLREFGSHVEGGGYRSAKAAEQAFEDEVITPFLRTVAKDLPKMVEQDFIPASLLADFSAEAERRGLRGFL